MTERAGNASATKFVILLIVLTVLVMGTTVTVAHLLTAPPRGYVYWVVVEFLCLIEFLTGMLVVNQFARARSKHQPSTPAVLAAWSILAVYAVAGLGVIFAFAAIRPEDGGGDVKFAAVFLALTVVLFVAAAFIYGFDLFAEGRERVIDEGRAAHKAEALSVRAAVLGLRQVETGDGPRMVRVDRLVKRLETIEQALAHSHGGGAGARELRRPETDPAAQSRLSGRVAEIVAAAPALPSAPEAELDARLKTLEVAVSDIEASLVTLQLA